MGCGFIEVDAIATRLWVQWGDAGTLTRLHWVAAGEGPPEPFEGTEAEAIPEPYGPLLAAYLAGEAVDPAQLPVTLVGTAFQQQVWQALRKVPRGAVRSYAGIASDIGSPRAMRAVGSANGSNPLPVVVPCHRVVEAGMRLGGYSGGLHIKRFLLELEGVKVVGDHVQPGQLDLL